MASGAQIRLPKFNDDYIMIRLTLLCIVLHGFVLQCFAWCSGSREASKQRFNIETDKVAGGMWQVAGGRQDITLHYITLAYITLHYITLHYITLHYITLHYTT